jgi:nucleoid-associated protein YgaU
VLSLVLALLVSSRTLLLNRSLQQAASTAPTTVEAPVVPAVEPAPAPAPAPAVVTPPPAQEATAPVAVAEPAAAPVQPAPSTEAKATRYKIKWGDTLWDISNAYYRNPWLYPTIARFNKIRNPNLIISGTYIDIPPK